EAPQPTSHRPGQWPAPVVAFLRRADCQVARKTPPRKAAVRGCPTERRAPVRGLTGGQASREKQVRPRMSAIHRADSEHCGRYSLRVVCPPLRISIAADV